MIIILINMIRETTNMTNMINIKRIDMILRAIIIKKQETMVIETI